MPVLTVRTDVASRATGVGAMSMAPDDLRQWVNETEAFAFANARALEGMSPSQQRKYVRRVMKSAEVVYAIWHEGDDRHVLCIKGSNIPEGTTVPTTAIFVRSAADALGMQREWGDGNAGHPCMTMH
jgi:hypothetical protein